MQNKITEIQVAPVKPNNGLVGFASFVFDNCFYLGSIGIYTRPEGGYRLTYPTRAGVNGSFNIFHPINRDISKEIEDAIINRFEEVTKSYVGHNQVDTR